MSTKIPSLDEIAGTWGRLEDVAYPPAVHNFHEMIVVNREFYDQTATVTKEGPFVPRSRPSGMEVN